MTLFRSIFFVLIVAAATLARAELPLPLSDGERLSYRVSWAVVPGAGEIKVSARQDNSQGTPRLVVTSNTATRGIARALLRFKAEATSTFDLTTGKIISLQEKSEIRSKVAEHIVLFDYGMRRAFYSTPNPAEKTRPLVIPEGDPTDLIIALLQTRTWNIKPGEKRDALVLFDDDFYELTLHATGYQTVKTSMGTFNTLVLEPRMDKTPPKGMFRKGSTVRVWIAQDRHRLPVKFEVEFKIGTGTATLESHEPGSGAGAEAAAGSR